ncbi:MAG TPA: fumarylacetoacetase [Mycobacteriales bacterium]|nr:fumarylacetoacetase [Mycobacteriales bacterium]
MPLRSWVPGADGSLFGAENLPYGRFSRRGETDARRGLAVAIGSYVLDLAGLVPVADLPPSLAGQTLNGFMAQGPEVWSAARSRITRLLIDHNERAHVEPYLVPIGEVDLHLPYQVGDYVDFYSSEAHATNVGRIFRPDQEPLSANWKHLPIGYHGRAGTVVVSGTPVVRPRGQSRPAGAERPTFGPSTRLDIEAEVGFVVGKPSMWGAAIPVPGFADHVFGACLLNDWSARDLQAWETVPLGPFLAKSFATSVSPWLVPLAALSAARVRPPRRDPAPLPYLEDDADPWALDISLEIRVNGDLVSHPPFAGMYWTAAQQLAHLTVNGASVRTGDLYASGTVSGTEPDERGSLLELTWNGQSPLSLSDGSSRSFLEDGDSVVITGSAPGPDGTRIGFGEVAGRIRPAPA